MGFETRNIDTYIKNDGTIRAEYTEQLDDKTSIDIILEMNDKTNTYGVIIQTWVDTMEQLHKINDMRENDAYTMGELFSIVMGWDNVPIRAKQCMALVWNAVNRDIEQAHFIGSNNVDGFTVDIWQYETIASKHVRYEVAAYDGFVTVRGCGDSLRAALMDLPRNAHETQRAHCAAMFKLLGVC